jgi:type II secretory pathway pseudopilin PulG
MRAERSTPTAAGFTFPEIVATITLAAALGAVVVPAVTNQQKKGDPVRTASDAQAIRGAVEQFVADVHRYPNSVGQLTNQIRRTQKPLSGSLAASYTYAEDDTARWQGPYLARDSSALLPTGYNWKFLTTFVIDQLPEEGAVRDASGAPYVILEAPVAARDGGAAAMRLDRSYDDGNLATGSIRYRNCSTIPVCANGATDTLKILLIPVS